MDFLEPGYIIGQSGSSDSGPIDAIDSASNTITLEGLVDFTVGSPVFSSVSASATCMGYDPTANTMLISGTEGKWAVNQGKFVEGTVKRLPKYQSETSELVAVGSVPGEYQIEQSLIAYDGYLSRTPGVTGNRSVWTFSMWVKVPAGAYNFLHVGTTTNYTSISCNYYGQITAFSTTSNGFQYQSVATDVMRFGDWTHLMVSVNLYNPEETAVRIWVDGTQLETTVGAFKQGGETFVNGATSGHRIGWSNATTFNVNGNFADFYLIDGQALEPSAFGEIDPFGKWRAKRVPGHLWSQRC